jgi:polyisoprenoid-binding protein YceI
MRMKNEAVRLSFDTTIEQSDINMGVSFRAKNNATDLKIAIENIKIAP